MKTTFPFASLFVASAAIAAGRELPIVSEENYPAIWQHPPGAAAIVAGYPAEAEAGQAACVNLGFVIGADGSISDPIHLKSWISPPAASNATDAARLEPFLRSSAAALSLWRLVPANGRPRPIFTSATFVFGAAAGTDEQALREHCRIGNLRAMVEAAARHPPDSDKNRRDYERGLERGIGCSSFSSACQVEGSSR